MSEYNATITIRAVVQDAVNQMQSIGRSMQQFGQAAVVAGYGMTQFVTRPLVDAGVAALTAAGNMEQTRVAFRALFNGDMGAADAMIEKLKQFAYVTPFAFEDLTTGARQLMAVGQSAESVIPTLTAIGDAVAYSGGNTGTVQRVLYQLMQMGAKGKWQQEDIHIMMESGMPVAQILAAGANFSGAKKEDGSAWTAADIMAKIGDKKEPLEFNQGLDWFKAGVNNNPQISGMMKDLNNTMMGQWMNLQDRMYFLSVTVGNIFLPIAKKVIDWLIEGTPLVQKVVDWFTRLDDRSQFLGLALGGLVAAAGPALVIFGSMAGGLGTLISVAGAVGGVLFGSGGLAAGISGAVTAIGAGITWVAGLITTAMFGGIGAAFSAASAAITPILVPIAAVAVVLAALALLVYTLITRFDDLKKIIMPLVDGIMQQLQPALDLFKTSVGDVNGYIDAFMGMVNGAADVIVGIVGWLVNLLAPAIYVVIGSFVTAFETFMPLIMESAKGIWDSLNTIWVELQPIIEFLAPWITAIAGLLVDVLAAAFAGLAPIVLAAVSIIMTVLDTIFKVVADVIGLISALITGDWKGVWEHASSIVADIFWGIVKIIRDALLGIVEAIAGVFGGVKNIVLDAVAVLLGFLQPVFQIVNGMIDLVNMFTGSNYTKIDVQAWQNDLLKMKDSYQAKADQTAAAENTAYNRDLWYQEKERRLNYNEIQNQQVNVTVELDGDKVGEAIARRQMRYDGI